VDILICKAASEVASAAVRSSQRTLSDLRSRSDERARHQCNDFPNDPLRSRHGCFRFRNASAFDSWLDLCPEKKISGGKVFFTKSRRVRSRVAIALRLAAYSLHHAKDYMGEFFRRICQKLGKPQVISATAHKLARIVYHLACRIATEQAGCSSRCLCVALQFALQIDNCTESALRKLVFILESRCSFRWLSVSNTGSPLRSTRARRIPFS